MTLIEKLKIHFSSWIKIEGSDFQNFYWQYGYESFPISPKDVRIVKEYIQNQAFHHKKVTFQDEYRLFLKNYDERYVWD